MAKLFRRTVVVVAALVTACGGGENAEAPTQQPNQNTNQPPVEPQVELSSLAIDLGTIDLTIALGDSAILTVEGAYSDGTARDLTTEATWSSSNEDVLRFTAPGQLETVAQGAATISVTYEGMSASEDVVVAAPRVAGLTLDPAEAVIGIDTRVGGGLDIAAMAAYSDGSTQDVTSDVEWISSNRSIGFMSATDIGRLALFGPTGEVMITARFEGLEATGTYLVTGPQVQRIAISPVTIRADLGRDAVPVTVEGTKTDGEVVDLTAETTWVIADPTVASIEAGLVTGLAAGETTITATYILSVGGVSTEFTADATIRVRDPIAPCPYPTNFDETLTYDGVLAPYEWLNAFDETGANVDLFMERVHCDTQVETVAFIVGAGWCPYCPAFKALVDGMSTELAELGMQVVYVEIETNGGAPASHTQANDIVNRAQRVGESTRIGAQAEGNVSVFGQVPSLPNLVIVRTSDMKVIRRGRRDDLQNIAANPNQLYGDTW